MYYESDQVETVLRCAFCSAKFSGVIKLVPRCGNSICEQCYVELKSSIEDDESRQFECRECRSVHTMPEDGLEDNRALMRMLEIKPKEKALTREAKRLKIMLEDVQNKISALESRDAQREIDAYCHSLEEEVTTSIESAMKHLNQLQASFLAEIRRYREQLKASATSAAADAASTVQLELNALSKEVAHFAREWVKLISSLGKAASDHEILKAKEHTEKFQSRAEKIIHQYQNELFKGRFLRFKENGRFHETNKYSGCLEYDSLPNNSDSSIEERLLCTWTKGQIINQAIVLPNNTLAISFINESIKIYSLDGGKLIHNLATGYPYIISLAVLNNGWLVGGSFRGTIRVWDLEKRELVRTLFSFPGAIFSLEVLPSGKLASLSRNGMVSLWQPTLPDHQLMGSLNERQSDYSPFDIYCKLGVLSNGFLVTACFSSKFLKEKIKIWDPETLKFVSSTTRDSSWIFSLTVLPNDEIAMGYQGGKVNFFDKHCRHKKTVNLSKEHIMSPITLRSRYMLSMSISGEPEIKIWDPTRGKHIKSIRTGQASTVVSLAASSDGAYLVSVSDENIKTWLLRYEHTDDEYY